MAEQARMRTGIYRLLGAGLGKSARREMLIYRLLGAGLGKSRQVGGKSAATGNPGLQAIGGLI